MTKQTKRGFTLIELLVVIAIIGVLSSVVLASLNSARQKSRDAKRIADVKQLQLALELYFDTNTNYPTATETTTTATTATALAGLASTYIATIPVDPLNNATYFYKYLGVGGTGYCVGADLEGTTNTLDTCAATEFAAGGQASHVYRLGN